MSKLIDLTEQDFGYWHVLGRAENDKGGKAYWTCKCTACGKIKRVSGTHLRGGRTTNCGCVRMEKMRLANIKDETEKQYGYLKVKRMAAKEEQPRTDRSGIYWVCDCQNCGRKDIIVFGDYLRNGDTQSCGCLVSKNESLIAEMLKQSNIQYQQQYTFNDLTSTGRSCDKLMFDFAIFNQGQLLYLIEYDGIQHFSSLYEFREGGYETTHNNDLLKNRYCFHNKIPLIRIPYNKKYSLNDLKLETTQYLLIPENEEEYYQPTN